MNRLFVFLAFISAIVSAQKFTLIPLGVRGGLEEANMSSYLISEGRSTDFLCLDAGSIYTGVEKIAQPLFKISTEEFIKQHIKAYFISHPHFDHLNGLVINSPIDSKKKIYANFSVIDNFVHHIFNNTSWANFGSMGNEKILNQYEYQLLEKDKWYSVENTSLQITEFPLSHDGLSKSSAVLVKSSKSDYFLYLGDTGADKIEKSEELSRLWQSIAPLVQQNKLVGISIECSFDNSQNEAFLFGHLTPKLLIEELKKIEYYSGSSLSNIPIIITHIKPKQGREEKIKEELSELQNRNIKLIFPKQGKPIYLY